MRDVGTRRTSRIATHAGAALAGIIAGLTLMVLTAGSARGQTADEIACLDTIGTGTLRFTKVVFLAESQCKSTEAGGVPCNTDLRDRKIARATSKLDVDLLASCSIPLEPLNYPGPCFDEQGPPFTAPELFNCLRDAHQDRVDSALAIDFPSHPDALAGVDLQCARLIGSNSMRYIKQILKYRRRCAVRQAQRTVPPEVDCHADPTGDERTDELIQGAIDKYAAQIGAACGAVAQLENLGFPGLCPDPDGPPFVLADLIACLRDTHRQIANEMFTFDDPPAP